MKRYLVFIGEGCYPKGGAEDLLCDVDTKAEVIGIREQNSDKWVNCIDTETNQIFSISYDRENNQYSFVTGHRTDGNYDKKYSKIQKSAAQFKAEAIESGKEIKCKTLEKAIELAEQLKSMGYSCVSGAEFDAKYMESIWGIYDIKDGDGIAVHGSYRISSDNKAKLTWTLYHGKTKSESMQ